MDYYSKGEKKSNVTNKFLKQKGLKQRVISISALLPYSVRWSQDASKLQHKGLMSYGRKNFYSVKVVKELNHSAKDYEES